MQSPYFELVGRFWAEWERAHMTQSAALLYFRLLQEANQKFWQGPLLLSWAYLQHVLGVAPDTLGRAISDLKSRGLITYERSGKRSAFWFPGIPDHLDNPSKRFNHLDNQSNHHLDNPSANPSKHPSESPSVLYKDINTKTIRQEDYKTKK